MIEYHKHTAADLRAWLLNGTQNGLSEQVISRIQAFSLLHNPYVTEDSVLAVSAREGDAVVGYVAGFPDHLARPKCKCVVGCTLYVKPEYTGDFIGFELVKQLKESYPDYHLIGSDETKTAAMIDKLLGNKIETYTRGRFDFNRTIHIHTMRTFGAYILEPFRRMRTRRNQKRIVRTISPDVRLEYTSFVDGEAYQFIETHSEADVNLRTREMLTWALRFPYTITASIIHRTNQDSAFGSQISCSDNSVVKVYLRGGLVGVYALGKRGGDVKVLMLYTEEDPSKQVFAVLLEHLLLLHPQRLFSQYRALNDWLIKNRLSLHAYRDQFLYTHPVTLSWDNQKQVQGMDGDMFA